MLMVFRERPGGMGRPHSFAISGGMLEARPVLSTGRDRRDVRDGDVLEALDLARRQIRFVAEV